MSEWILVNDELPYEEQPVLVCCISGYVTVAELLEGEFYDVADGGLCLVKAWMPLPEPLQSTE